MQLLSTSLRVISNIFDTMRPHLKLQQELFLSFLLDRLVQPLSSTAPGARKAEIEAQLDLATWAKDASESGTNSLTASVNGRDRERERERDRERGGLNTEARELMLEILGHFARGKYSLVDFWVNYDCNVDGEDLFERLVKFLSRVSLESLRVATGNHAHTFASFQGVFPSPQGVSYIQENSQFVCLDTLLELVSHMAARLDEVSRRSASSFSSTTDIASSHSHQCRRSCVAS